MKVFTKIFLSTVIVISLSLSLLEYYMISINFKNLIELEMNNTLNNFRTMRFILQPNISIVNNVSGNVESILSKISSQASNLVRDNYFMSIYDKKNNVVFSNSNNKYKIDKISNINDGKIHSVIKKIENDYFVVIYANLQNSKQSLSLIMEKNITNIFIEKNKMEIECRYIFLIIMGISTMIMFVTTYILTRPIKELKHMSIKISNGDYSKRVRIRSMDEIGELGYTFNNMADKIEENIEELKLQVRQKEDFVANFTHELKTPLTSIIGYADMLYRNKLEQKHVREAADYIFNEGMRLEGLSFKLMDLIVLNKQEFLKEIINIEEFFKDIETSIDPITSERNVKFTIKHDYVYVKIEYDLLKTLILNLIDNSIKANSSEINLIGEKCNDKYIISIIDNGCGIPNEDIERITEAFYMVNKSRSRELHGAGLGLALASKIAKLHNTQLVYKSTIGEGTIVSFSLVMEGELNEN
ncbi:sensor histidine kinase [Clostridium ihumii]|uniref:sensor histidine kinase n=1 Tax=Clostridium ihumii TaxID=1470356 RepID=UPI00059142E0|nr:HAMP domain-containing sensor histidine kinase [Clostridium ihumii]